MTLHDSSKFEESLRTVPAGARVTGLPKGGLMTMYQKAGALLSSMRLRTRILLLAAVLAVSSIWGVVAHVTSILQQDMERLISDEMSSTLDDVGADLERDIGLQFDSLERVAADIKPVMLLDPPGLQRYLRERQVMALFFPTGLMVADRAGNVLAGNALAGPGSSIADQPYFQQVLKEGSRTVGSPVRNGRLEPVPLAVPLRDESGMTAGALIGMVNLNDPFLLGQFETAKFGATGYFVVVERSNRMIIAAPQPGRTGTQLPPRGKIADLDRRLDEGFDGAQITVTALGQEVLAVSRNIAQTDWVLLGGVPTAGMFAPVAKLKREIFTSALVATLLVLALLRWVLTSEFGRLERAAQAIRRMTKGDQPLEPLRIMREDEIGSLKRDFNLLLAERSRLEQDLRTEADGHKSAKLALEDAMKRLQGLTEHMTRVQGEERRRLSFELHERWGQELSALKFQLQALQSNPESRDINAGLKDASEIARQALERVRRLSVDLHPRDLDELGLCAALRSHCAQIAKDAGWILDFDAPQGTERLDPKIELACFRVAEEALLNIVRHARATYVQVRLCRTGGALQLDVCDNGIGFDVASTRERFAKTVFGLMAMEEQVRQLGGRFTFRSSPGEGTELRAEFPVDGTPATEDAEGR